MRSPHPSDTDTLEDFATQFDEHAAALLDQCAPAGFSGGERGSGAEEADLGMGKQPPAFDAANDRSMMAKIGRASLVHSNLPPVTDELTKMQQVCQSCEITCECVCVYASMHECMHARADTDASIRHASIHMFMYRSLRSPSECKANPHWMRNNCRLSCNVCTRTDSHS